MKIRVFAFIVLVCMLGSMLWIIAAPRYISVSKLVSLVQRDYRSVTINDKCLEAGSNKQYLIDDFIPRLSVYTVKAYKGELPENHEYLVTIKRNDGQLIALLDNNYLKIDDDVYEIVEGTINLSKFYKFID